MTMRKLLNIAMPFMRQSGEVEIVVNRTTRKSSPGFTPGKTPRATLLAGHRKGLYGLPCARCGVYYAAELAMCPVCNSAERVFPKVKPAAWPASAPRPKAVPLTQAGNLGGLGTINRELLANQVQPMARLTTTEAMPALA